MERTELLEVERILNYSFKKKSLLEEALTHSSVTNAPNYQRLAFIGDAALRIAISNYVYKMSAKLLPRKMSSLRDDNVNNEKLARVAIKHELYRFLRRNDPSLDDKVRKFADAVSKEDGLVKAPKFLADIVESVAGAIYVDVDFDLQKLWRIFGGLLEPIITWEKLEQQPVTELSDDEDNGSSEIKGAEQNLHELCCKKKWPKPLSMLLRSFLLIILLHLLLSLMITFPEPK